MNWCPDWQSLAPISSSHQSLSGLTALWVDYSELLSYLIGSINPFTHIYWNVIELLSWYRPMYSPSVCHGSMGYTQDTQYHTSSSSNDTPRN